VRLNDCLSRVYNVWLLCVVFRVAHGYITEGGGRSLFEQHLFGHTLMCDHLHALCIPSAPPLHPLCMPPALPLHALCALSAPHPTLSPPPGASRASAARTC